MAERSPKRQAIIEKHMILERQLRKERCTDFLTIAYAYKASLHDRCVAANAKGLTYRALSTDTGVPLGFIQRFTTDDIQLCNYVYLHAIDAYLTKWEESH